MANNGELRETAGLTRMGEDEAATACDGEREAYHIVHCYMYIPIRQDCILGAGNSMENKTWSLLEVSDLHDRVAGN